MAAKVQQQTLNQLTLSGNTLRTFGSSTIWFSMTCSVSNDEQLGIIKSGPLTSLSLPVMPWSDWEIDSGEIQICLRPNGAEWELGCGSFGKVGF